MLKRLLPLYYCRAKRVLCSVAVVVAMWSLMACRPAVEGTTWRVERGDYEEAISADGTVQSVNTSTILCPPESDGTVTFLVEDGTYVHAGDTLCIVKSAELESSLDDHLTLLDGVEAEIEKARANYALEHAVQESQLASSRAEAELASLDSVQLRFSPPVQRRLQELNLRKAAIQQERLRGSIATSELVWNVEFQRLDILKYHILQRIEDRRAMLKALTFTAPYEALALRAESWNTGKMMIVGEDVWEGCPLIVLPDLSAMEVLMRVPENDYKRITIGDTVTFTFPSDPEGAAWGHVTKKIPVGTEATDGSKVRLFDVTASVDSSLHTLLPQSTALCKITTRLLPDTLMVPAMCIETEDSVKVVYVRDHRGRVERRVVDVAMAAVTTAIIAAGLEEGEEVMVKR